MLSGGSESRATTRLLILGGGLGESLVPVWDNLFCLPLGVCVWDGWVGVEGEGGWGEEGRVGRWECMACMCAVRECECE